MHFETTLPPKKVEQNEKNEKNEKKNFIDESKTDTDNLIMLKFQIVKKIIKKVVRAHRTRPTTTTEEPTTTTEESTKTTPRIRRTRPTTTTTTEEPTTRKIANSFFNSMEQYESPSQRNQVAVTQTYVYIFYWR